MLQRLGYYSVADCEERCWRPSVAIAIHLAAPTTLIWGAVRWAQHQSGGEAMTIVGGLVSLLLCMGWLSLAWDHHQKTKDSRPFEASTFAHRSTTGTYSAVTDANAPHPGTSV